MGQTPQNPPLKGAETPRVLGRRNGGVGVSEGWGGFEGEVLGGSEGGREGFLRCLGGVEVGLGVLGRFGVFWGGVPGNSGGPGGIWAVGGGGLGFSGDLGRL